MRRRAALRSLAPAVVAALLVVVVVVHWWRPFLTNRGRAIESTPSLAGFNTRATVPVPGGSSACVEPVTFVAKPTNARFTVHARGPRAPRLRITADAPGYHSTGEARGYPVVGDVPVEVALPAAPRTVTGALCLTPVGRAGVELVGTNEPRSLAFARTTVDGKEARGGVDVALSLFEARSSSVIGRTGRVLERASAFTGGWAPVWLLWPALVVAVLGLPLGVVAALLLAQRDDRARPSSPDRALGP
jgi:hypothetical protein